MKKFVDVRLLAFWILFSLFFSNPALSQPTNPCMSRSGIYPRPEPKYSGKVDRNFHLFDDALAQHPQVLTLGFHQMVHGKTVDQLQQLMQQRKLSAVDLLLYYVHRVQLYDTDLLNSIIELNPEAFQIAQQLDAERGKGKVHSGMHGIPVLLKDNIATADQLHSSAGTAALRAWKPTKDAALVHQLRNAGAIIFGKANMSEWANYMDPCMPSGFSTNGGQTRNPYGAFDTYGSSSGSAVAVASDLVTVSIGSETQGSIIMPAGVNGIVGLKPTMGLINGEGVVPLMLFQDVAGPMGRTVNDVAVVLNALTANTSHSRDFTKAMTDKKKWKVGLPVYTKEVMDSLLLRLPANMDSAARSRMTNNLKEDQAKSLLQQAAFDRAGIQVVPIPANQLPRGLSVGPLLQHGFKKDLNAWLQSLGAEAPFGSLEEIIAFNKKDTINRAPYGMGHLLNAQNNTMTDAAYDSAIADHLDKARSAIDGLLKKYGVDVIASQMSQMYAPAGYPAMTVPTGYDSKGQPTWIVLTAGEWGEYALLAVGYKFEQATKARRDPDLESIIPIIKAADK